MGSWPDLVRALGALDTTPGAVPELITALRTDADPDTRMAAASEDPRVRGFAAEALTGPRDRRPSRP